MNLFRTLMNTADSFGKHTKPSTSDVEDRALLRRIANQDREALASLYRTYHRRLARFLARLTHHYELVEEVINDVFWVVWQKAGNFRDQSRVSTWIIGITYRRALKTLRQSHKPGTHIDHDTAELVARDDLAYAEQTELLNLALASLPLEQRMALELTYYQGCSCEEIALITDCPVNTVKTRMFHARRKLRELLPTLDGSRLE